MISLKKAALAVLTLSVSGLASAGMYAAPAAPEMAEPAAKSGFYVGAGVGGIGFSNKFTGSATGTSVNGLVESASSASQEVGDVGFNSTLLAGYTFALPKRFSVGLEAFGNYTNTSASQSITVGNEGPSNSISSSSNGDLKMDWVYGVRLLPGYQVTEQAVAYAILGYARGHADLKSSGSNIMNANTVDFPESTKSENFNGYQVGLGSMIEVAEHVSIRGDLIYTGYASQTSDVTSADGTSKVLQKCSHLH